MFKSLLISVRYFLPITQPDPQANEFHAKIMKMDEAGVSHI